MDQAYVHTPSSNYLFFSRNPTQRLPRFLSLDVFAGQKTKEFIDNFKATKCTTSFIPGGATGFVQLCDTVVNRSLKARIKGLVDQYIDQQEKGMGRWEVFSETAATSVDKMGRAIVGEYAW